MFGEDMFARKTVKTVLNTREKTTVIPKGGFIYL